MMHIQDFILDFENFFLPKGWKKSTHSLEYRKRNFNFLISSYSDLPRKRQVKSIFSLSQDLSTRFNSIGVQKANPIKVVHNSETFFLSAGIQILDDYLKSNKDNCTNYGFVNQPVIRLNTLDSIHERGKSLFLSSFVNPCTIIPKCKIEDHLNLIDNWFDVISSISLHCNNFVMRLSPTVGSRGSIKAIKVYFTYVDLEVGDAVYLWNETNPSFCASDIGWGLERIYTAVTREKFFDDIIFNNLCNRVSNYKSLDALRTITLMASQGLISSNTGVGGKMRKMVNRVDKTVKLMGADIVCKTFFEYWSFFYNPFPLLSFEETIAIIRNELIRSPT